MNHEHEWWPGEIIMSKRQLIEEATTLYWSQIERRKHQGMVVHQQPNKKLSTVEMVNGVLVVILKNVRGVLARIRMTSKARKRAAEMMLGKSRTDSEDVA